jgi:hypothetical protein
LCVKLQQLARPWKSWDWCQSRRCMIFHYNYMQLTVSFMTRYSLSIRTPHSLHLVGVSH